jgi:hypothetical protein
MERRYAGVISNRKRSDQNFCNSLRNITSIALLTWCCPVTGGYSHVGSRYPVTNGMNFKGFEAILAPKDYDVL